MKEIVLVQPKAGAFDLVGARLPLALLSIAAIPCQKGYNIKIIDQRLDHNWPQTLRQALKRNPICVGITCMTGKQIGYALKASKLVKGYSTVPVVWGGVHTTLLPEQSLSSPYIDIVVLREGEITFMELIESLEQNISLKDIKGIAYKRNGQIIKNADRDFIKDLDQLPELPYELVKVNDYTSLNIEGRSLDFATSRGCPFKCSFCYNNYFNKGLWRTFSAREIVRRLKKVVRTYKIKTIYFPDDNFCADLDRLKEILNLIIEEKLDIKWGTLGLRIDTAKRMDDGLLQLMERSGCVNLDIGAESGHERILKLIDKRIQAEDIFEVNKKISKYPFIVKYTFMIGFPTETKSEMLSSVQAALRLARENKAAYTLFNVYTPYPGTPLYDLALGHGFSPPQSLEEWQNFNTDNWYFDFRSWLTPRQRRELKSLEFTSLFANKNVQCKINRPLAKLLFSLYYPLARFRFKNHLHFWPIDSLLGQKIFN